jgi:hypothetical protein
VKNLFKINQATKIVENFTTVSVFSMIFNSFFPDFKKLTLYVITVNICSVHVNVYKKGS